MKTGEKAFALILEFEGYDQPWEWPGGASGISIGHGYDLGYETHFREDWKALPSATINRLLPALGVKGSRADDIASQFRGVKIPNAISDAVLRDVTIYREEAKTLDAFPGSDKLHPDAFGALVSLVYNRGSLIDNSDRRKEMLALHKLFLAGQPFDLDKIAYLVRSQTRLWPNVAGLRRRRIAEADLILASQPRT